MGGRGFAAVLVMLAGIGGVQAQDYPTKTVTVIVPFAAGGPADVTGASLPISSRATSANNL